MPRGSSTILFISGQIQGESIEMSIFAITVEANHDSRIFC